MRVPFYKLSPGGNTTVLLDMPAPEMAVRTELACRLMDPLHLGCEQVGFLDTRCAQPRLDMMGGEFCGNAARSAAAVLAMTGHAELRCGSDGWNGQLAVSGMTQSVAVHVAPESCGGTYDASVCVSVSPVPLVAVQRCAEGMHVVRLEGITHVLLDARQHPLPENMVTQSAVLRRSLELETDDAVGCIWYSHTEQGLRIEPVVWVRETGSTHHETGCGSGSVALGMLRSVQEGKGFCGDIVQPSGQAIRADIAYSPSTGFSGATIGGAVQCIAQGTVWL